MENQQIISKVYDMNPNILRNNLLELTEKCLIPEDRTLYSSGLDFIERLELPFDYESIESGNETLFRKYLSSKGTKFDSKNFTYPVFRNKDSDSELAFYYPSLKDKTDDSMLFYSKRTSPYKHYASKEDMMKLNWGIIANHVKKISGVDFDRINKDYGIIIHSFNLKKKEENISLIYAIRLLENF